MSAVDIYQSHTSNMESPVAHAVAVTPADGTDLASLTRALYVGTAGDVRLSLVDGTVVTFANMAPGWHPVRAARIWATGTTAADIVGCW